MPRKRTKESKAGLKKDIKKISRTVKKLDDKADVVGKTIEKEAKEVEQWMIERKKFLVKLGWVAGIIIVLLVISHLYLRVGGFG